MLTADAANFAMRETWIVTAVNRFVIFADVSAGTGMNGTISGNIYEGSRQKNADTGFIRADVYYDEADEDIDSDTYGPALVQSVIHIRPQSGNTVTLRDVTILDGMIVVEGNAVLSGQFSGTASEGMPLLIASGTIMSEPHDSDTWDWTGVVAAESYVVLTGPGSFTGTVAGHTVLLDNLNGAVRKSKAIDGLEPRIRRLKRDEVWRKF